MASSDTFIMSSKQPSCGKVLILGAGIYQVPLIEKCKERGYSTVVVSPVGDYPGIELADEFVECDTTDTQRVLSIAHGHSVCGVTTTGTDVCIPTMAVITNQLGLNGPRPSDALVVSSKTKFREFLKRNELNCPNYKACHSLDEVQCFCKKHSGKVVIKPDDASGSRGVTIVYANADCDHIESAYYAAKEHSRHGLVCIESFIPGVEVGGDAFAIAGKLEFITITEKHMEGTVVKGHSLPNPIMQTREKEIIEALQLVVEKLGYQNGPLNFDLMIGPDKVTVLEMGLRNGGNGIPEIVKYCYGIDLHEMAIDYAVGQPIMVRSRVGPRPVSSFVFGAKQAGTLLEISAVNELREYVNEVIALVLAKQAGSRVEPFEHNGNMIGYLLFRGAGDMFDIVAEKLATALRIKVAA